MAKKLGIFGGLLHKVLGTQSPRRKPAKRNPSRPKAKRNPESADLRAARQLSQEFHGTASQVIRLSPKERQLPEYVTVAGRLDEFTYAPTKQSKMGHTRWSHESGDRGILASKAKEKPLLAADPRTGQPIVIKGRSPMRLTKRGFVG